MVLTIARRPATLNLPSRTRSGEKVLISIDAEEYYGLKGPASSITEDLETSLTFSALVDRLVKEHNVSPETFSANVKRSLAE
jgi:hypothetical protein